MILELQVSLLEISVSFSYKQKPQTLCRNVTLKMCEMHCCLPIELCEGSSI